MDKDKQPQAGKPGSPFNPQSLRLPQDFSETVGVRKELLVIPARRPGRQEFIRVHPDEGHRMAAAIIEVQEDRTREIFVVDPTLCSQIANEVTPKLLATTITRQGSLFLWPLRLPGADGRLDNWSRSALEALEIGKSRWIRIAANMQLGAYEVFTASAELAAPEWPDVTFERILEIAFRDHFIGDLQHPVLRRLRGEI